MTKEAKVFLFDLLNTPSPTGFEAAGQRKWLDYVRAFTDDTGSDAYGNAWAKIKGTKKGPDTPTLMLEAHADEIGYMVKHVTGEGFLHLDRIGGSDWANARGRRIVVYGEKGQVPGVIGSTAIHIRERANGEKAPEVHELYVDIGASNEKEVLEMGVRVGHPAVYADISQEFGNRRLLGRALDNRIGGFIIAQVLKKLSEKKNAPAIHVVAANAVQEEIGGMGAKMLAHRLRPDVCLVLDVTHATDTPGIERAKHGHVKLGEGPTVTHGTANHPEVVKRLIQVAADSEIPLQHEASSRATGTDTDVIYHVGEGIPSALVSLPLRYMHSVVEVADLEDVERVVKLLTEFAKAMTAKDRFRVDLG